MNLCHSFIGTCVAICLTDLFTLYFVITWKRVSLNVYEQSDLKGRVREAVLESRGLVTRTRRAVLSEREYIAA